MLSTGTTILLNVKVYSARKGFEKIEKTERAEGSTFWQEQQETGEEEAMRNRKEALGALFGESSHSVRADHTGRIGVKPILSNSLLLAQKKPGSAAAVFDTKALPLSQRNGRSSSVSPRKGQSPRSRASSPSKGKGKASAQNTDGEDDEDSGDEAEKLNDEQMNEIDTIYRK